MEKERVQKQLNDLYQAYLPKFLENTDGQAGISYPLFIHAFDEYFASDTIKIMFVGKETYGWGGNISDLKSKSLENALKDILNEYNIFSFGQHNDY